MPGLRTLSLAALVAIGLWVVPAVAEEAYPSRLVKVIVPFPPGSTLDALARILTDRMAQRWGQPVIIENVSGGGGNIGAERVARSAPDGYTLMFSPPGPLTINPLLYSDVAYDPAKFVPVSLLAKVPNVLVVRNTLGAGSIAEVIALARANPDKLTYASQGVGSTAFLTAKLFETRAGIRLVHVPYRGAGPALNDIVAGHVDMMFDTAATSSPCTAPARRKSWPSPISSGPPPCRRCRPSPNPGCRASARSLGSLAWPHRARPPRRRKRSTRIWSRSFGSRRSARSSTS